MMGNVFITSDTHLGHNRLLTYCPRRAELVKEWGALNGIHDLTDIDLHDKWIVDRWNEKVEKGDTIYILGDFSFRPKNETREILQQLRGNKILIRGNHDEPLNGLEDCFSWVGALKEIKIKGNVFPGISESFNCMLCHYPLLTWRRRASGGLMLHGHCHGGIDGYNEKVGELRFDVGIDGRLADGSILSIQDVYDAAKGRAGGMSFSEYLKGRIQSGETFNC